MSTEPVTGTDVIRQALAARLHKGGLPGIARELHIEIGRLESFARGQGPALPPDVLALLTREMWGGHFELNLETGLLRSANRAPAQPGPVRPPSASEMKLDRSHLKPRVANGVSMPVLPKAKPRPGWE